MGRFPKHQPSHSCCCWDPQIRCFPASKFSLRTLRIWGCSRRKWHRDTCRFQVSPQKAVTNALPEHNDPRAPHGSQRPPPAPTPGPGCHKASVLDSAGQKRWLGGSPSKPCPFQPHSGPEATFCTTVLLGRGVQTHWAGGGPGHGVTVAPHKPHTSRLARWRVSRSARPRPARGPGAGGAGRSRSHPWPGTGTARRTSRVACRASRIAAGGAAGMQAAQPLAPTSRCPQPRGTVSGSRASASDPRAPGSRDAFRDPARRPGARMRVEKAARSSAACAEAPGSKRQVSTPWGPPRLPDVRAVASQGAFLRS